jgi:hypothetical protein
MVFALPYRPSEVLERAGRVFRSHPFAAPRFYFSPMDIDGPGVAGACQGHWSCWVDQEPPPW